MFFKEAQNCWKVATADRVAFLVDGEAYFRALAEACEAARKVIYIIGWDVDSRIRLRRDDGQNHESLGQFVDRLAHENPELQIYILEWDFAMFYSVEREFWPMLSFDWQTHERVHFALDDVHPVGASHHQKIVVVDDRVAFVGGFDLARCRWDTPAHAADNPQRREDDGAFGPFHDVQMMVDGDAAAELANLARHRWKQATGDSLPVVGSQAHDPWPAETRPDLENAAVAILRTVPGYEDSPAVREIESFYLEAIERAETSIYIENQYLTSHVIGTALENSLRHTEGPEILCVLPKKCSGWLEQETMGDLRQRLLKGLCQADQHQRLKICYPDQQQYASEFINVHSKILIVDDALLTIGSANLSNRSMGFDSECNLALSADGQAHVQAAIAGFRNRLLAEHLGSDPESVADKLQESGSLLATVEAFKSGRRSLQMLGPGESSSLGENLPLSLIADPERPVGMDDLLDYLGLGTALPSGKTAIRKKAWRFGAVIVLALILAILWRWSPLNQWLNMEALLSAADSLRASPLATPIVLAIYVLGSCLMFPVTLMILATALSFGPFTGFALAFTGSLLGGLASYLLGRWLGRDVVRKLAGEKINRLSRKLAKRGWLAIAVVRVVPIAPYTIVNMVAGSLHISTRSFLIGTAVGMSPGIMAIMIFEGGLEQALRDPGWGSFALASIALSAAALSLVLGRRWLLRRDGKHGN